LPTTTAGECFLPDNNAACALAHNASAHNVTYNTMKWAPVARPSLGSKAIQALKRNMENTELYSVQPFRLAGVGKPNLDLARQTYAERTSVCNTGWCQDNIQAATLGLTDEAARMLVERAAIGPQATASTGNGYFRFRGYTPDGEAGELQVNNNQLSGMRTGLNHMLMLPVDDANRSMLLFPSFPVQRWNVRFKLMAPRNTTIEASCQDGKLEYLRVTPLEREKDVTVLNCR
jgi:hypothetical protein